jgi:hypothetical protein
VEVKIKSGGLKRAADARELVLHERWKIFTLLHNFPKAYINILLMSP